MRNALAPEVLAETKIVFERLAEEWKASRGPATTASMMTRHPAYSKRSSSLGNQPSHYSSRNWIESPITGSLH